MTLSMMKMMPKKKVRLMLNDTEKWRRYADNARRYFLANHTVEVVGDQFERLFREILQNE